MFLGTLRSPWPWQSTVVPVQEHWGGHGWLSALLIRTRTRTVPRSRSLGAVSKERPRPTERTAPTMTAAEKWMADTRAAEYGEKPRNFRRSSPNSARNALFLLCLFCSFLHKLVFLKEKQCYFFYIWVLWVRKACEVGVWSHWVTEMNRVCGCATAAQTSTCPRHAVARILRRRGLC